MRESLQEKAARLSQFTQWQGFSLHTCLQALWCHKFKKSTPTKLWWQASHRQHWVSFGVKGTCLKFALLEFVFICTVHWVLLQQTAVSMHEKITRSAGWPFKKAEVHPGVQTTLAQCSAQLSNNVPPWSNFHGVPAEQANSWLLSALCFHCLGLYLVDM